MGSNPISPTTLVLDTSPLQALHRCGALELLRSAFVSTLLPAGVFRENQDSLAIVGEVKIPDLGKHSWIEVQAVSDQEIVDSGAMLVGPRRSTQEYRWHDRPIDRPELEAILLAQRPDARLLVEDGKAVRCARDRGVPVLGTAELLVELERAGHLSDADDRAKRILSTGYFTRELEWLSRRVFP